VKVVTDTFRLLAHNPHMSVGSIDREYFSNALEARGWSQADLARAIGLHTSALSNALKGTRKIQLAEVQAISAALHKPLGEILIALGISEYDYGASKKVLVQGYVGASDEIVLFDHFNDGPLETVDSPFPGYHGTVVRVRGDSAAPRYRAGELLAYTPESGDIGRMVGREAIVKLADGRLLLKQLQRSSAADTYILLSINPAHPPILDVMVEWCAPIDWHRP
jgi:transcriptional regulator with XRE-family HTH domain